MSKVYAWYTYEKAKEDGLFYMKKIQGFHFWKVGMKKPDLYLTGKILDMQIYKPERLHNSYVKPIDQEPAPNLDLLESNE